MIRVCPRISVWMRTYRRLLVYCKYRGCETRPPPPLISLAWEYSDVDKLRRWKQMVEWAEQNGCGQFLAKIPDDDFHIVFELSDHAPVSSYGPTYLPADYTPKERPQPAELAEHLERLRAQWPRIIDERIAPVTHPRDFTGGKARRLLVDVIGDALPPWGDWTSLSRVEAARRTFTRFRAAINESIKPHHVDHVDFVIR